MPAEDLSFSPKVAVKIRMQEITDHEMTFLPGRFLGTSERVEVLIDPPPGDETRW